ncbi:stalk domain-containing protein [Aneurinibacillus aneurinilyticus]|uniref:Copper amine oxidase domain protein n=1 Tax=Aneurinibacillus aneurinilyticus ATCC 12856 TaxID=649747 RepID=U1WWM3_ANEAE|nr:protease complex subunit PrcB family protein [Aneurinibacillus aneurinilyticus]ERI06643.1 hypothetical protein HMPREF0083_05267 [Aneurinibacillus aneurinilyticus ATCC 12856]MED0670341.1 protease complex subunit PrcB family protein [Aneurinibacillus aneurinilyticus]MED0707043.1 protease complex subunit PrcB family protein [Aneurinibacillus aneurinilyticus]MED0723513.1 protease complex subunit PrcB family protein [Aneurinibacillus aneurinilyticus]MED0732888.1 protease complex subunit PrcB fam
MKKRTTKTFIAGICTGVALMSAVGFSYAALTKIDVSTKPVSFTIEGKEIKPSDKEQQYFNGKQYVPASFIHQDTTYVPLRFIAERLGFQVGYDAAGNTISLKEKNMAEKEMKFQVLYPLQDAQSVIASPIQQWFDSHKKQEFTGTMKGEDGLYAAITRGQKPNGGYGVEVVGVTEQANKVIVKVKYTNPQPGKMYTQVITYPATLVKIPHTDKEVHFEAVN